MGIGDLVKNIRASIGIPKGTIGLITNKHKSTLNYNYYIYEIQWIDAKLRHGRRLEMDLEVIG